MHTDTKSCGNFQGQDTDTAAWTVKARHAGLAALMALWCGTVLAQDKTTQIIEQGETRTREGAQAQRAIDRIAEQRDELLTAFRTEAKVVDGLEIYNELLEKQITAQQREIDAIRESIANAAQIERQIVPLCVRMIAALTQFIAADMPFLVDERKQRIAGLESMMARSDVATTEKLRRVFEAYQIENEYGRTIEAYRGKLDVDGAQREVDFLRIGRVALLYQTPGGQHTGMWDKTSQRWVALAEGAYVAEVRDGLRIARKQLPPDLLVLPVTAPQAVK